MKQFVYTTILLVFLSVNLQAQNTNDLYKKADSLIEARDWKNAVLFTDSILNFYNIKTDSSYYKATLANIKYVTNSNFTDEMGLKCLNKSLEYTKILNDQNYVLKVYIYILNTYYQIGKSYKGIQVFEEALSYFFSDELLNNYNYADFLMLGGDLYRSNCNYNQALKYYKEVLKYATNTSEATLYISSSQKIIDVLQRTGSDIQQIEYYKDLTVRKHNELVKNKLNKYNTDGKYYYFLVNYYQFLKQYDKALIYWDSTVHAIDKFLDQRVEIDPYFDRNNFLNIEIWDYDERIILLWKNNNKKEFYKLLSLIDTKFKNEIRLNTAEFCQHGGEYCCKDFDFKKAEQLYQKSNEILKAIHQDTSLIAFQNYNGLLNCNLALKKYSKTDNYISEAEKLIPLIFNSEKNTDVIAYYENKGFVKYFSGDKTALEKNLIKSARLMSEIVKENFGYLNSEALAEYWSKLKETCSKILTAAIILDGNYSKEFAEKVYQTSVGQKNINFISQNRLRKVAKLSIELENNYFELITLKRKLLETQEILTPQEKAEIYVLIKIYEKSLSDYFDETVTEAFSTDFQKIKSALKDGEIAVEFTEVYQYDDAFIQSHSEYCNYDYVAIAFSNQSEQPLIIPLFSSKELENFKLENSKLLKEALTERSPEGISSIYSDKNLTDFIWKKILDKFPSVKKIWFSPTGYLYSLALENLKCDSLKTMSDIYKMIRISSTSNITANVNSENFDFSSIALFGGINYDMDLNRQKEISEKYFSKDKSRYCLRQQIPANTSEYKYLNAAYEECDYVLKKAKDKNVTFFYGDSAVEESFKYYVQKRPEIIHIATHGFYDEYFSGEDKLNAPLFSSSLVFAGVNNYLKNKDIPQNIDDGFLSAMEISEYDLSNTKLAVLSACETGLGFVNSDGIFGLQRGFKLSGVQSVLMSLWSISDEATSIFMRKFYASLLSGKTPHQSLRIATDYLKEGNRFSHPYYWAGFVLVE